jgi:hypothetical protein
MLFARKRAFAHLMTVDFRGTADVAADLSILLDEARPELIEQTVHVVRDEHLAVAADAGADAELGIPSQAVGAE